jgi:hypothetical protein
MSGGVGKTKFKILPKVSGFTDAAGVQHLPGEIVDLPESYRGETWLRIVEEPKKNSTPSAEIEAERPEKPAEIRLELKKTKRKTK